MNPVKISIIIPVFNSGPFLRQCLDSVVNQTLKEIEIICINDGSTDNSPDILNEYAKRDPRFIVIDEENRGQSMARNTGIKASTGEYIGFVDSDDRIDGQFFEKLYHAAKSNDADISMASAKWILSQPGNAEVLSDIGWMVCKMGTDIITNADEKKSVIATNTIWNKLFLREFIFDNHFMFFEGLCWEDVAFVIMTTIRANKICLVRDTYYHYRKHEGSITSKAYRDRKSFDLFEIMAKIKLFFDSENIHLNDSYKYYYGELLYHYYLDHLLNFIHKKHKKEFYYQVQHEFRMLDKGSIDHLNKRRAFRVVINLSYPLFSILCHIKKHTDKIYKI